MPCDLNGEPTAAVVLIANTGGSGSFANLVIVQEQGGEPVQVASTLLGDRVTMNWLTIANDLIQLDMVTQGPNDPMCCATQRTLVTYTLDGSQLINSDSTVIGVQPQITGTVVMTYVPTVIPTATQKGSCFANAIGLGRADAWRCTTDDNAIHDPCFQVDATPTIVCGADPITGEEGFVLELTEPLPAADPGTATGAWIVQLADGTICSLSTGTIPGVGDQTAPYACADDAHSNLMEDFTIFGTYWYAQSVVFTLSDDGFAIQSSVRTPVSMVWH